jgi:hypothetical protein
LVKKEGDTTNLHTITSLTIWRGVERNGSVSAL